MTATDGPAFLIRLELDSEGNLVDYEADASIHEIFKHANWQTVAAALGLDAQNRSALLRALQVAGHVGHLRTHWRPPGRDPRPILLEAHRQGRNQAERVIIHAREAESAYPAAIAPSPPLAAMGDLHATLTEAADHASLGMAIWGMDGTPRVMWMNRAGAALLGVPMQDVLGGEPVPYDMNAAAAQAPTAESSSLTWRRPDGHIVRLNAGFSRGEYRGTQCIVVFFSDDTARHDAIDTLQVTMERLARSNEDLDDYATAIGHDLRGPLRSIYATLQKLGRSLPDDRGAEMVPILVRLGRLDGMLQGLLECSRFKGEAALVQCDLDGIIREAAETYDADLRGRDGRVEIVHAPTVMGDPNQLGRLFGNLISNSLKYGAQTDAHIRIDAEHEAGVWRIHVDDNGPGLGDCNPQDLFRIFGRGPGTANIDGHGVGLAMCQRIVEGHGGHMEAGTSPLGGARFSFTLPAVSE